ncbi:ACT domain-containing protein ACR2 [Telopea speciosissima]|uniref:ACT domain-containing protein ACR2 n=1 Tax=Telopea speciosissima TaxID=54955 RepID=UPI001CC7CB41|nr:ACT domain-containing protein ACR2 [Telopea speciosissima]
MKEVCWPYFDPEFENLNERVHGPSCRVCIDNESFNDCTVVKVDSVNRQGLLLQVVQALSEMDLSISKSYVSSDAGWFMDVFHVTDQHGGKLTDEKVINYIRQAIVTRREPPQQVKTGGSNRKGMSSSSSSNRNIEETEESPNEHTAIELSGTDRPGLFSEISAALADLRCNVIEAHAWSHNERLACVAYIEDQLTHSRIDDPRRLATIEDHLSTVLHATTNPPASDSLGAHSDQGGGVKTAGLQDSGNGTTTNVERRLHQLMFAGRDFDGPSGGTLSLSSSSSSMEGGEEEGRKINVSIEGCNEKGYSVVSVECKDRPKLMFDTVCALTDMQYMVFHASISSHAGYTFQEYYIRHVDGCTLNTGSEKERLVKCLEAAIERRVCEGVRLKLCGHNRAGLLSDITRMLRENGLAVVRADVETRGDDAVNAFYVRDMSGNKVDMETVESMRREMGPIDLEVKNESCNTTNSPPERSPPRFSLSDLLRSQLARFSLNFISIR